LEIVELETRVVSANRLERPLYRVGSSVEVLERYELARQGNRLLLDSLRLIPGLYFRNNGGPGTAWSVSSRGLSGYQPKVLVNGIEVSNPSNGQMLNVGEIMTSNVDRVEVLKGAQSSLYGADALAGVISIDTLEPGGAGEARFAAGYGSHDTWQAGFGHSGSAGDLSWSADISRYGTEGFSVQDPEFGPSWEDDDAYRTLNVSLAAEYSLGERTALQFSGLYVDAYAEFDPGIPGFFTDSDWADNRSESENLFLRLGLETELAADWQSELGIGYTDSEFQSLQRFEFVAAGERLKIDWNNRAEIGERWQLATGLAYEEEDNISDLGDREDFSLYAENVIGLSEQVDLTLGFRFDDNSSYGSETTYRATFNYWADELGARVHGSWGTSFLAPSFFQLFNPSFGNPDLKPEFGESAEIGFSKALWDQSAVFSTAFFRNWIEDKIGFGAGFNNLSTYESDGFETSLRVQAAQAWDLQLAYTYTEGQEASGVEALRVPRSIASAALFYAPPGASFDLGVTVLSVSSQFSTFADRLADLRQPGYEVINLSGSYKISEEVRLWGRIGNALDEQYEEIRGFQAAPFELFVGLRSRF